jgi:hypothetical protein
MSFVEDALVQLAQQSVGGSNLYSYSPDNGDTISDVQAADYFSQSRFINQDGWVNGFIFCVLSDGSYIVQIGTGGATGSQFGAGGTDISVITTNIRGIANIDMGAADYTISIAEAQCAVLVVSNVGNGTKKLIWPDSAIGTWPSLQTVTSFGETQSFIIKQQSTGVTDVVEHNTSADVAIIAGYAAINLSTFVANTTRAASNGVVAEGSIARTIADTDGGLAIESTNAAATTLTIPVGLLTHNLKFQVRSSGAGGVTIAGSGGVTVTGKTALATGNTCTVYRRGDNENYVCF